MPDTILQLGDFVFKRFEIPNEINFGGPHAINRHRLPGGRIVIDSMGPDPGPLTWKATLKSPDADERARELERMKDAGLALEVSWGGRRYSVVITAFDAQYQRFHQIPYSITLEVLKDLVTAETPDAEPTVDDMMVSDLDDSGLLIDTIGDPTLSSLGASLFAVTDEIKSFALASRDTLSTVEGLLGPLQARAGAMFATGEASLTSVVGGVLAGSPGPVSAASLIAQVAATENLPDLGDLGSLLGRVQTNLAAVRLSGSTVTVAGADLIRMAADTFGDGAMWTSIARVNNLTDPLIDGIQDILIPPTSDGSDGVLNV